ncbi:MAG: hypothetical protein A2V67_09100 [Deltaproteobacteria bacterium RBG_13_61_14]|nr:MAG: hypothetical protein A2V67_09100 [Deltaproteobacteria bacterium RBG_13_61_14]
MPLAYKLIVMDVDGTLVDCERRISTRNLQALQAAKQRGLKVTLASGRSYESITPFARTVGVNAPLILYNGCRVQDFQSRRIYEDHSLPLIQAQRALKLCAGYDLHVNLYIYDRVYIREVTGAAKASMQKDNVTAQAVGDLLAFLKEDPTKILLIGEPKLLQRFRREYLKGMTLPPELVLSEPDYLEILPAGVSKGSALLSICRRLDILPQEVIAFGDGPNDLEMLRYAGLGVAVANAHPAVKAAAEFVTAANDEDGVAAAIEKFILS